MSARTPSSTKALRRLFLTLFLRGRSARGLNKAQTPKSVATKLATTLILYGVLGGMAFFLYHQPVFTLSLYLHGMTFVFLGMFVAASAGEVLFNKEEGEILLHRPITARTLLWAKIGVLVEVSLWLALAFNLAGFFVGVSSSVGWVFLLAHALSTILEALLCTGFVVLTYELCLRWFGRERLDGLMTTVQVIVAVGAVIGGQIVPQLIARFGGKLQFNLHSWWIGLLPPAWFAGLDEVICRGGDASYWVLGALALIATSLVLWLAFGKLARDYETGLQTLAESSSPPTTRPGRRRWIARLVNAPPLTWWLRDSIARASFLLTAAYLFRDRETKLRIYPGLAPMLVMPVILLLQGSGRGGASTSGFSVALTGAYFGLVPLLSINLLRYSQQWQASDVFRAAPVAGPAPMCHGMRRAVAFFVTLPLTILLVLIAWLLLREKSQLLLLLPGIIALPVYGMVACVGGKAVPFSAPSEEAKSAGRGAILIGSMLVAVLIAAVVSWAWSTGWFWWLIMVELAVATAFYFLLRRSLNRVTWPSME